VNTSAKIGAGIADSVPKHHDLRTHSQQLRPSWTRVFPGELDRYVGCDLPESASAQTQTSDSLYRRGRARPAIHEPRHGPCRFPWMPGTRPGMTIMIRLNHLNGPEH